MTAVSGAALAMLDQQDAVRHWWNRLPGFLEEMQGMLGKPQAAVEDLSSRARNCAAWGSTSV